MFQQVYLRLSLYLRAKMGENGRPWTAMFAFFAMAILMAILGPAPAEYAPIRDVARAGVSTAPRVVAAAPVVDSR
jgi:hypothetical protein